MFINLKVVTIERFINVQISLNIMDIKPKNLEKLRWDSENLTLMLNPENDFYKGLVTKMLELGKEPQMITRTTMWQWTNDYDPKTRIVTSGEGDHFFTTPPVLDAFESEDTLYAGKGLLVPKESGNISVTDTGYFWQTFFNHPDFLDYGVRRIPKLIVAGDEMRTHPRSGATSIPVFDRLREIADNWNIPLRRYGYD